MAYELPADPNFWVAVSVAVGTGALAIITALYMVETRKLRKETAKLVEETSSARKAAQRPSFAIEPVTYDPKTLYAKNINLVNTGQTEK